MDRFKRLVALKEAIGERRVFKSIGFVKNIVGLVIESHGPESFVGEICKVLTFNRGVVNTGDSLLAEVIGFKEDKVILMPLGDITGISVGSKIIGTEKPLTCLLYTSPSPRD